MSAPFALVYWIVIPILALWLSAKLIRRAPARPIKGVTAAVCAAGLLWLGWVLFGGERWLADRQVRELCAKDGGIKVYETVKLPPDKFGQWRYLNFFDPTQHENALGPEYIFKWEDKRIRMGFASSGQYHISIIRRSDQKLLGEAISYWSSGGYLPGPWHGGGFNCPENSGEGSLIKKIFVPSTQSNKEK